MKKILFILMAIFVTNFTSYAQLQTKTIEDVGGYKTVYKFWMGYGCIRYCNGTYILMGASTNDFEDTMHSIILGDDKKTAIMSLKDLSELKKSCPTTIVVPSANNRNTKIYKLAGETIFESEGVAGYTHALFYLKIDKAINAINNFNE
jgi:hypothetical protein